MAVGTNLLGRNVRCPHCKQVVRAPAAPGEAPSIHAPQAPVPTPPLPAPGPQFNVPVHTEHHESIFGEAHDEDVFGTQHLKPTMPTLPSMPVAPPPLVPRNDVEETAYVPPQPVPQFVETQTYEAPAAPMPDYEQTPATLEMPREPRREPAERSFGVRQPRMEQPGTPAFAWILLAYSALITIVAGVLGFFYFTGGDSKGDHPFKAIPDFYGQYEKANRKSLSFKGMPDPKGDVPADLRVKLGEEITVGDIQVRPTTVTKQVFETTRERASQDDLVSKASTGLVMAIKVKNVSTDTTFFPNDLAFNRAFDRDQPLPYTALQIRREFFYGPFPWPLDADAKDNYVTGYQYPKEPLGPGQEQETWVFVAPEGMRTAGDRLIVNTLKGLNGDNSPLLWRVQLRRGMMKAKTEDGKDVEVSATAVIGVEFRPDQIKDR
ncbi:MAG TPA: hypothetical protein VHR66_30030 [Gemmataceae bacterium]|jgi:hypothetical protein|nr:hypothetical protein [Gemmataceae bacterium]